MTTAIITPGRALSGAVQPPPSKSMAHRAMLALMLSGGEGTLSNLEYSQDIQATERCAAALRGRGGAGELPLLDCGESGSTLRFLIPIALALGGGGRFTGRGRLMQRPQGPYFDLFDAKGIAWRREDGVLTVQGRLEPGEYPLPGNVSSQFITGLLFALPLLEGDSRIVLTSPLESEGYVELTLAVLARFGVRAEREGPDCFLVPGGQRYRPCSLTVEADWSQAAFWYAANTLGSHVEIQGMDEASAQGDKVILSHCRRLSRPGPVELDLSQCPDLAPPLAAMGAGRTGETRLVNAARLRMKESDRLASISAALGAMGVPVETGEDYMVIRGVETLPGGCVVDSCGDHRIAMMAAILATRCREPVTLTDIQCVEKSYPTFWEHYRMLGGSIHVI